MINDVRLLIIRFLLVATLTLIITAANAQTVAPRPLSLAEAVQLAQTNSPTLRAAAARIAGARARAGGAGRLPNTVLGIGQPFGSSATGGFDEGILLSQAIELPGKVNPRRAAAAQARTTAETDATGTRLDVTLSAQTAYFEWLRADGETAAAESALGIARKFADIARIQFQAGDAPRSAVVRAEIEQSRADQALTLAKTDRDARDATLKSLTGLPADVILTLTDSLTRDDGTAKPLTLNALTLETARQLARTRRPDLLSARALLTSRRAETRAANSQRLPDFAIEGRRATLDPRNTGQSSVRFAATFPLFDNGRIRSDVKAAEAAAKEQEALLQETERTALLEVDAAYRDRESARIIAASFEGTGEGTGRLAKSKELLDMAQIGYTRGGSGSLEVIDAQRTYQSEQTEYLRALAQYRTATARLERAIGGPQ